MIFFPQNKSAIQTSRKISNWLDCYGWMQMDTFTWCELLRRAETTELTTTPWRTPVACQGMSAALSLSQGWISIVCTIVLQHWNSTPSTTNCTSTQHLSDRNHLVLSYSYRPRRSFLSCLRRIWACSRLGPWCTKPCQVSSCLPLSIWCLTSSSWRDATFTIGTVVGRPWAHCKGMIYSADESFFP
jgi:hypothetical protein